MLDSPGIIRSRAMSLDQIPDEFTVQTWTDLTPNSEFEESSSCSSSSSRIPIVSRSD